MGTLWGWQALAPLVRGGTSGPCCHPWRSDLLLTKWPVLAFRFWLQMFLSVLGASPDSFSLPIFRKVLLCHTGKDEEDQACMFASCLCATRGPWNTWCLHCDHGGGSSCQLPRWCWRISSNCRGFGWGDGCYQVSTLADAFFTSLKSEHRTTLNFISQASLWFGLVIEPLSSISKFSFLWKWLLFSPLLVCLLSLMQWTGSELYAHTNE